MFLQVFGLLCAFVEPFAAEPALWIEPSQERSGIRDKQLNKVFFFFFSNISLCKVSHSNISKFLCSAIKCLNLIA